jgi:maleate isomerase
LQSLEQLRRVGVVVPPANPAAEPELAALLSGGVALHVARLPVIAGDLPARLAQYAGHYAGAIAGFGSLQLEAIYVAMTGASYALGVTGDRALAERLAAAAGTPVWTASLALHDALARLGAARIALVSPYPQWLTDQCVAYWAGAGFAVAQVVKVSEEFRAYELATGEIADALAKVDFGAADAVVLSGTGMLSLPAIVAARASARIPLLSSNLCGAWRLLDALGLPAGDGLRRAAPELAARLRPDISRT